MPSISLTPAQAALLAVIGAFLTASGVVIGALITAMMTGRRELDTYKRQFRKDTLDAKRALYEDALLSINISHRRASMGTPEEEERLVRMQQKLALSSTKEIYDQYMRAGEAIDAWAVEAHQAQPKDHGGLLSFHPSMKKHEATAQDLFPTTHAELDRLRDMMRDHLTLLEASAHHISHKEAKRFLRQAKQVRSVEKS